MVFAKYRYCVHGERVVDTECYNLVVKHVFSFCLLVKEKKC